MPLRAAEELLSVLTRRLGMTELEFQFHRNPHPELWVIPASTLSMARYDARIGPEIRFRLPEDAAAWTIAALRMRDALDEPGMVCIDNVDLRWDDDARAWNALEVPGLHRLLPADYAPPRLSVPAGPEEILIGVAALWFLGKLADAYVSRLGEMLAESAVETQAGEGVTSRWEASRPSSSGTGEWEAMAARSRNDSSQRFWRAAVSSSRIRCDVCA